MNLNRFLSEERADVIARWFEKIVATYPPETAKFLKAQQDPFRNPVGAAVHEGVAQIFDGIADGCDQGKIRSALDGIIRIRAVQDFSPSHALSFIFSLKAAVLEALGSRRVEVPASELSEFETTVDRIALLAFDIYMECREKLYEIRANELRRMTFRLLQRANDVSEGGREEGVPADEKLDNPNEKEVTT